MRSVNGAADADPASLRISVDTKASVVLGDYSRGGKAREREAVRSLDHDLAARQKLVPVGVLEVQSGQREPAPDTSAKTSDLLSDTLEGWRQRRGPAPTHVKELVINADASQGNNPDTFFHDHYEADPQCS